MTKTRILLFLPVLILLGWMFSVQAKISSGAVLDMPIRGYDPRDILAGHYLSVRVDFDSFESECKIKEKEKRRYHFDRPAFFCADSKRIVLNRPEQGCEVFIEGSCPYDYFRSDVATRFYISEKHARVLDRAVRDRGNKPMLRLSVTKDGRAFPVDLILEGIPYKDWLKKKPNG